MPVCTGAKRRGKAKRKISEKRQAAMRQLVDGYSWGGLALASSRKHAGEKHSLLRVQLSVAGQKPLCHWCKGHLTCHSLRLEYQQLSEAKSNVTSP